MATVLLSFLGRSPKSEGGYRTTVYRFDDGARTPPLAFVGWALRERVSADRIVVMGTSGSMWDYLLESDLDLGAEQENLRLQLVEAVAEAAVRQEQLMPLEEPLSRRLGCQVRLVVIPYCRTTSEQVELIGIMARQVETRDLVHLDISHSFRHLPLLTLVSALYLEEVLRTSVKGIWYGAFDPDTHDAPVYNLQGLLQVVAWIRALHSFEKDGDYAVFAPFLGPPGKLLARAAFFERTSSPEKARQALSSWFQHPGRRPGNDPAADLFLPILEDRLGWYRAPQRSAWERALAERYLERRDYLRAAIYLLEAVLSAAVLANGGDPTNLDEREDAKKRLQRQGVTSFTRLNQIRNALAHSGPPPKTNVRTILDDENDLRRELTSLLDALAPSS